MMMQRRWLSSKLVLDSGLRYRKLTFLGLRTLMRDALEGGCHCSQFIVLLANEFRTIAWAIDLDDGTTINALGSDLNRTKSTTYDPSTLDLNNSTDLGGN